MTRKDFVAIAKILNKIRPHAPTGMFAELVRDFANILKGTNPEFDRERFVAACLKGVAK
jgi:hypothetical protein